MELVKEVFQNVEGSLQDICLFHTDRGNEFKNQTIEEVLEAFSIKRSLSHKGCPYDNAVAEATFKIIKTEFIWNERFDSLEELRLKLWIMSTGITITEYIPLWGIKPLWNIEKTTLKILSKKVLTIQSIKDCQKDKYRTDSNLAHVTPYFWLYAN